MVVMQQCEARPQHRTARRSCWLASADVDGSGDVDDDYDGEQLEQWLLEAEPGPHHPAAAAAEAECVVAVGTAAELVHARQR